MRRANPGRGEVDLKVDGQDYILAFEMGAAAAYQAAVGVQGLGPLGALIIAKDLRALLQGVKCLAVAGDTDKLAKLSYANGGLDAVYNALYAVLMTTFPKDTDVGNAGGVAESPTPDSSPRADTSKSPVA
jgi:hypothetical protein